MNATQPLQLQLEFDDLSITTFLRLPIETRVRYLNQHYPSMSSAIRRSLLRDALSFRVAA